jgi:hypothetical protein
MARGGAMKQWFLAAVHAAPGVPSRDGGAS